ncbi:MAG: helix-turn-helix domain-containing protein [bacterium]
MQKNKREKLEQKGWRVGNAEDFLDLTAEEIAFVEMKLSLCKSLKERRKKSAITQIELAKLLKSSQSRVAKMEAGDPTVSLDLLIRSLLAMGATPEDLAKVISTSSGITNNITGT